MHAWEVRDGKLCWLPVAEPVAGAGETVVRVTCAGVCGSDVAKLAKPVIPTPPGQPWRPGHEIVGWSDDRLVAVDPLVACDACPRCLAGQVNVCPRLRTIGWHLPGGFAPYVAVPVSNVVEVPVGVDEASAVLAEPVAVAVHGIRCGLDTPGGRLAVIGGGALATASAAYAAARGWSTDLLVRNPAKFRAITATFGANIRPLQDARPRAYDAVVDAAGGADDSPLLAALDAVRDGGTIVVQTAYYPGVRLSRDLREPIRRAVTIVGSFTFCRGDGGRASPRAGSAGVAAAGDFIEGLRFLGSDTGWAKAFTSDRYALADLPQALAELRSPSACRPAKVVLMVTGGSDGHD